VIAYRHFARVRVIDVTARFANSVTTVLNRTRDTDAAALVLSRSRKERNVY
jgi:hypothetical protein